MHSSKQLIRLLVLLWIIPLPVEGKESPQEIVERILKETPLIDGHNDLLAVPEAIRESGIQNATGGGHPCSRAPMHTDLPRLEKGDLGDNSGPFTSRPVWMDPAQCKPPWSRSMWCAGWSSCTDTFGLAHTAEDVRRIHKQGKVASLIGMEGGIPLATLWRSCVKCLNWVPDI